MFKEAIKRLRELMKAFRGWDKMHAKEDKLTEENLKYYQILIWDDQTNNDEI